MSERERERKSMNKSEREEENCGRRNRMTMKRSEKKRKIEASGIAANIRKKNEKVKARRESIA